MEKIGLPDCLIMIDCEMTGVIPTTDHLLQVAALKLKWRPDKRKYYQDGPHFLVYLKHDGQPENDFHKKHLATIFKKCNKSETTPAMAKEQLHSWLGPLKGKTMPAGDCIPTDITFLYHNGIADYPDIDKEGTFHYEFFDMNSIKMIGRHILGAKPIKGVDFRHEEPEHDALMDCRNQTRELNFYLRLLLKD